MNESAFYHDAIGVVVRGAVTRNSLFAGGAFLLLGLTLLLFLSGALAVSAPGTSPSDASAAEYLDLHFSYQHERFAPAQMSDASCR